MRSNRLWIGATCGVALALSVVASVDAGTQTAGAQAKGEPADQLAQGQKHVMTPAPTSRFVPGGKPAAGELLWARVSSDGTIITQSNDSITSVPTEASEEGAPGTTVPLKDKDGQVVPGKFRNVGDYLVNFNTNVGECSWSANPFVPLTSGGENGVREALGAVTARVKADPVILDPMTGVPRPDPKLVRVYVFRIKTAAQTDNSVVVQVLC